MKTTVDNTLLDLLIEWDLEHLHNRFTGKIFKLHSRSYELNYIK